VGRVGPVTTLVRRESGSCQSVLGGHHQGRAAHDRSVSSRQAASRLAPHRNRHGVKSTGTAPQPARGQTLVHRSARLSCLFLRRLSVLSTGPRTLTISPDWNITVRLRIFERYSSEKEEKAVESGSLWSAQAYYHACIWLTYMLQLVVPVDP
jgi:hypothetical protein